ncbi:LOW QUALITY PROTEIN: secretogranin-2 [Salmo salar]|uniref:LOW QUALITY PROTEIN: secretogranin-2 n=1 Tax=Salmo salar TaxID=8030 RepID=A0A1S3T1U3_SALSA|nr:LOW QUALITY PROTEIN: secretogranin-2 [Salmo salar]
MPSLPTLSSVGMAFLLSLLLLLFLLGSGSVQGASLREHRLKGSELDPQQVDAPYLPTNADMLKALEYIESLRQRTGGGAPAPQEQAPLTPDYDTTNMDTDSEKLRSMLRLASPAQTSQSKIGQDEEEDEEGERNKENKTQEWLQAVLSTLQQTEKGPKPAPVRPSVARHTLGKGRRPAKEESQLGEGVAYPWSQQQRTSRPHSKYPLMFEDEEDGEEETRAPGHESPFKRTNENMEGKYTPQNLANLQSVFEELGRIANAKAGHKRQTEDDEEEDDDDDDMFRVRNLAYENVMGGEDWAPLEEQVETEDEENDNRQEFDRGLEDDEEDDDNEDEEDDEVKRSSLLGPGEHDPDDITKLVDYYLLKVLEKTEQEERKRELEEEEEREERRATQTLYSDKVDPQAIYQLIQISQKLQIPPEDLMDMLKSGEMTKQDRTQLRTQAHSRTPNDLARVEDKLTQISSKKNKIPPETFFNRRLPETQTSNVPYEINTEDIQKLLRLGSVANQNAPERKKQKQHTSPPLRFYAPAGRQKDYMLSEPNVPEKGKGDYDNTVDEDELATYLAAQMFVQYPQAANKADQKKRASQPPSQDGQLVLGKFEKAVQDYFDQMDSDKSPPQKRQSEPEEDTGGALQTHGLDDDTLLKVLGYLNPETEEGEDQDLYAKPVKGM